MKNNFYNTKIILQKADSNTICMLQRPQKPVCCTIFGGQGDERKKSVVVSEDDTKNYNFLSGKIFAIASCAECTCRFS